MRNYVVENLTSGKSKYGVDIQGLDNAPIYDVRIANSSFNEVADGSIVKNVRGLKLDNVTVGGRKVEKL
jgi:hypothetical protein